MPQSEEAAAWFAAVYETIQQVPRGRVTTYGHIAALVGTRKHYSITQGFHLHKTRRVIDLLRSRATAVRASIRRYRTPLVVDFHHVSNSPLRSQVGVALKHLPQAEADAPFREDNVPWQRVINSKGTITPRLAKASSLDDAT